MFLTLCQIHSQSRSKILTLFRLILKRISQKYINNAEKISINSKKLKNYIFH